MPDDAMMLCSYVITHTTESNYINTQHRSLETDGRCSIHVLATLLVNVQVDAGCYDEDMHATPTPSNNAHEVERLGQDPKLKGRYANISEWVAVNRFRH